MPSNNILRLRITIYNPGMNNNNNNNNQTPLMLMRDRLFQVIFMRFSIAYATAIPNVVRKILENLILFFAFLSLFVLAYTHVTFIYRPMNCLDSVIEDWPRQGILRIEINQRAQNESYTLKDSYLKEAQIRQMQGYEIPNIKNEDSSTKMPDSESSSDPEVLSDSVKFDPKSVTSEIENSVEQSYSKETLDDDENAGHFLAAEDSSQHLSTMYSNPNHSSIADGDALSKTWYKVLKTLKDEEIYDIQEVAFYEDVYILEYSLEYGYLRLSPKAREKLNIPVMLVSLDPNADECFGNWFTKMVMKHFLGYNNILMASIRKLADKEENKGFIRNVVHDHYFRFVNIMNHLSYAYAALIMLVFTLSISMLLRYSHQQIFFFIVHVLRLFEFRGSTSVPTASLLTVILALVGMEAIMSEFFSDPTTSFYVILIVWVADQYDAICCRTVVAKRHWLRFFYLYHYAFYAYDYRFSGQYSDLALFTSCCFIFHSMVFFFHHYELPAILRAVHHDAQQHRTEQEQIPPGRPDEEPRGNEDPNPIQEDPGAPDPTNESTADNQSANDSGDVENDSSFVESQSRLESCSSEAVADDFFSKKLEPHDDNKSSQKTLKDSDFDCVDCGGGKLNMRSGTVTDNLSALRLKDNDLIVKKPGETYRNGVDDSFTSTSSSVPTLCQNKMAPTFSSPGSADKNSSLVTCRGDPANL